MIVQNSHSDRSFLPTVKTCFGKKFGVKLNAQGSLLLSLLPFIMPAVYSYFPSHPPQHPQTYIPSDECMALFIRMSNSMCSSVNKQIFTNDAGCRGRTYSIRQLPLKLVHCAQILQQHCAHFRMHFVHSIWKQ